MDMQTVTLIIPVCSKLAVLSSGNPKIHIQYFYLRRVSRLNCANIQKFIQQFKCRLFFVRKRTATARFIQIISSPIHSNSYQTRFQDTTTAFFLYICIIKAT